MYCPVCHSHNTGKTGSDVFFCSNCLVEFTFHEETPQLFYMDPEGNPVTIDNQETAAKLASYFENESKQSFEGDNKEINTILQKIILKEQ